MSATQIDLGTELLDVAFLLPRHQRQRHDPADVHLGSVHMHVELEFLPDRLDVLQTLLVIRASSSNPDLDLMLNQKAGKFAEGSDHALEGRSHL